MRRSRIDNVHLSQNDHRNTKHFHQCSLLLLRNQETARIPLRATRNNVERNEHAEAPAVCPTGTDTNLSMQMQPKRSSSCLCLGIPNSSQYCSISTRFGGSSAIPYSLAGIPLDPSVCSRGALAIDPILQDCWTCCRRQNPEKVRNCKAELEMQSTMRCAYPILADSAHRLAVKAESQSERPLFGHRVSETHISPSNHTLLLVRHGSKPDNLRLY
jgi:hypothetical protein